MSHSVPRGLNIHKRRKHGQKLTCDLCDETFETKRDLKMHRNKHSYSSNKYETENKCNECDFESTTIETMEVHIGKHKVQYYECGLCDVKCEIFYFILYICMLKVLSTLNQCYTENEAIN